MMETGNFFNEEHLLENLRVRLEPLKEHHYPFLLPVAMEKELWKFTSNKISCEADFRRYFDTALAEKKDGTSYPFAVYDKPSGSYAGSTRYANISFAHKKIEIGWTWYHPIFQRTGINKACKALLLNFGFENLKLNRIELKTSSLNLKSQGAMLKIGAVKEGVMRKHMITENGLPRDTIYFSFINDEWPMIREKHFIDMFQCG